MKPQPVYKLGQKVWSAHVDKGMKGTVKGIRGILGVSNIHGDSTDEWLYHYILEVKDKSGKHDIAVDGKNVLPTKKECLARVKEIIHEQELEAYENAKKVIETYESKYVK